MNPDVFDFLGQGHAGGPLATQYRGNLATLSQGVLTCSLGWAGCAFGESARPSKTGLYVASFIWAVLIIAPK
jgi:hypothetical protein